MEVRNSRELGALVRDQRKLMGMSQEDLAKAAGVGRPWVVALESGSGNPTLKPLLRLLQALTLTITVGRNQDVADRAAVSPLVDLDELLERMTKGHDE